MRTPKCHRCRLDPEGQTLPSLLLRTPVHSDKTTLHLMSTGLSVVHFEQARQQIDGAQLKQGNMVTWQLQISTLFICLLHTQV